LIGRDSEEAIASDVASAITLVSPHYGYKLMSQWIDACAVDDIDLEDVFRFDHGDRSFAIYRSPDDGFFATDGFCTHENTHLADGLVIDDIIECPKHNGRYKYKTGEACGAPVCVNLQTFAIEIVDGRVM
jgi:3-phenylpropionate/trans-cinnamate dioxygenase ferredoxin subunit